MPDLGYFMSGDNKNAAPLNDRYVGDDHRPLEISALLINTIRSDSERFRSIIIIIG